MLPGLSQKPEEQANCPTSPGIDDRTPAPFHVPSAQSSQFSSRSSRSHPWSSDLSGSRSIHGTEGRERPTYLSSPESPLDKSNPLGTDRIFPIRSIVSVDPSPSPSIRSEVSGGAFPGMITPNNDLGGNTPERRAELRHLSMASSASIARSLEYSEKALRPRRDIEGPTMTDGGDKSEKLILSRLIKSSSPHSEGRERMGGSRQMQTFVDNASITPKSNANETEASGDSTTESIPNISDESVSFVTARFKHTLTDGGHAVIIGREGDTLQRCEDEPIHIPGAVQSFGLLIALQEDDDGKFKVRVVSENSKRILGYTPQQLFALDSFCDILSDEHSDNLLDHVDFIRDEDSDPAKNGPEVFTIAIRAPSRKVNKFWCAMHSNEANRDIIICEFELEDDSLNPLVPFEEATPEPPEDTLRSSPTAEELAESTVNSSKPLRVLRNARKRKGEAAAMEVFNIMSQVQEQLSSAPSLERFLKVLVGVVKELTGFHRVMIYQFDQSWNGRVVTELVDPRATKDLYRGLHVSFQHSF